MLFLRHSKTMAPRSSQARPKRETKVLSLGLPKTGSASIAEALDILGYQGVYHGTRTWDNTSEWEMINRAADATYSSLPSYTGVPFTRKQWDELFGPYEAITDIGGGFPVELIKAYPEAKVLLVIRPFEKWFKSWDEGVNKSFFNPMVDFCIKVIDPLAGTRLATVGRKIVLGMFNATTLEEQRKNARETWEWHNRIIQEMVPPEKLLLFDHKDGWEPLCKFLGKPVPDVEFPWVNEREQFQKACKDKFVRDIKYGIMTMLPWTMGVLAVGFGSWAMAKNAGYI